MTQRGYVLSAAAEADVRAIIRYMRQQWGDTQVCCYITKLEQDIARLASGKGPSKDMSALHPTLRLAHCGHHYVFCLPRGDAPELIVAVLHERMDLMARLTDRLNGAD